MPHSVDIVPPGPKVLTEEQQAKVRELWYEMGKLIGMDVDGIAEEHGATDLKETMEQTNAAGAAAAASPPPKRGRFGGSKKEESGNDKHGSNKQFQNAINEMSHEELRNALWDFSKCDDPDSNLCRYLRARKWVVRDAMVMLVSTIHWRNRVMHLDDDVLLNGEEAAIEIAGGERAEAGAMTRKVANDFMEQLRSGKAFVHGRDKSGRPMCFIRVRLHKIGAHSTTSVERLVVYMIETARFMLDPPNQETVTIVFDMSEFGMLNMDYGPLKFVIKVFEANYPESLGAVLIHRAPWIFNSIWSAIKGWLDPVVASKIHFTKDVSDLAGYIDMDKMPRDMGGNEDWTYHYDEPIPGENRRLDDDATRAKVEAERRVLLDRFEECTIRWVIANGVDDAKLVEERRQIADQLYVNYWQLDPYVRSRSFLDRAGIIGPRRPIPDPAASGASSSAANGTATARTSSSPAQPQQGSTSGLSNGAAALAVSGAAAGAAATAAATHQRQDAPATPRTPTAAKAVDFLAVSPGAGAAVTPSAQNASALQLDIEELEFRRPFNNGAEGSFHLRNSNSVPVVFKIKITAPKQYLIKPSSGRLEAGQQMQVAVSMLPMKMEPARSLVTGAKILVQSVAVSSRTQVSPSSEWWSIIEQIADTPIQEKKIRVKFLPESSTTKGAGLNGVNGVHSTTNGAANGTGADSTSNDKLHMQLRQAEEQIALLTSQVQDAQKQKRAAAALATRNQMASGRTVARNTTGVPVSIAAGVCVISFMTAYLLF